MTGLFISKLPKYQNSLYCCSNLLISEILATRLFLTVLLL